MRKRDVTLIVCIICSIAIALFDFYKFDLILKVKGSCSLGAEIVVGFLAYIPYILYSVLAIYSLIYIFTHIKSKRWKAVGPAVVIMITTYMLVFFPYTNIYLKLFYNLNEAEFQKTIQMVNDGSIEQHAQGENKYAVPYRLTSYTGAMYKDDRNGETKVKFYAFQGRGGDDVIIVYSSADSGIDSNDFSDGLVKWKLSHARKICPNWYAATTSGYELIWHG